MESYKSNLKALTGEEITFALNVNMDYHGNEIPAEIKLNTISPGVPYGVFYINSYFITERVLISINIPQNRPIPHSITLKFNNVNQDNRFPLQEYYEAVMKASYDNERIFEMWTGGIVFLRVTSGRPRGGRKSGQTAEFILNFENYQETLVCPINMTTKFNMCFYDAIFYNRSQICSLER